MRISDWSSDVCSSDLDRPPRPDVFPERPEREAVARQPVEEILSHVAGRRLDRRPDAARRVVQRLVPERSEEHTSELQSLMRISYAVFCLKKKKTITNRPSRTHNTGTTRKLHRRTV